MGLFDMFKKKNSIANNENKSEAITNNVINNIERDRKIEGRYSFLNDFKHLTVFTGLSDDEINSYSQEFLEKFKMYSYFYGT